MAVARGDSSEDGIEATRGSIRCLPWSWFVEDLSARGAVPDGNRRWVYMPSRSPDPSGGPVVALRIEDRGGAGRIARITFDNPVKRNALGLAGKEQFIDVMTSLRHDDSLRAVVITGAGETSFVAGTDLSEMARFDRAAAEASATKTHRACDAVRTFPVPVIARINGDCFGRSAAGQRTESP